MTDDRPTHPTLAALDELARLMAEVAPERYPAPTPCAEYDVAALRRHILAWLPVFTTALADPHGAARPDADAYTAPADSGAATAEVRANAARLAEALPSGAAERPVRLVGEQPLPGSVVVGMLTGEVLVHGWDLARATAQPWNPSEQTCRDVLATLHGMLSPQFRGAGKAFGAEVPAPDDASPLDRLVAFSGRDPNWTPRP